MNEEQDNKVVYLRLDDIIPNRFQPREMFDENGLEELANSIREHGVIQPIIVRKIGDKYELIAGERRSKASALAGLTTIPAIIRDMDDKESAKVSLLENLQRKNLSAIEEARTYKRILELDNMTQEDLAKTMGRSQPMVANKLRLLSLPEEIQDALMKNQISERHARSLLTLPNKKAQLMFLERIKNERLTVRELDAEIKNFKNNNDNNDDSESETSVQLNKNEERFMNNNRGNFGGMGLNDYQTGINNNMFNNIPNNFNNMPNIMSNTENKDSQLNDEFNENYNTDSSLNNQFINSKASTENNEYLNSVSNTSTLGSMLDNNSNINNIDEMNDNSNLFVSHIREDNLPKVENQFLPNFDNFNQDNLVYNDKDNFNNPPRESLNNFQNNINYQENNSNNYNMNDNYMLNQNNYDNPYVSLNDTNNNTRSNFINQYNGQDYNYDVNNNLNVNSSNFDNINSNNLGNNFDYNNNYNIDNNQFYDQNISQFNNPVYNQNMPQYNNNLNYNYQNNQGELFNQPLNIVDIPQYNSADFNTNEDSISFNQNLNETRDKEQEYDDGRLRNINDNPLDDAYENILYAKPVPIREEKDLEEQEDQHIPEIEVIGDVKEEISEKENNDNIDNQYIKLEPEITIKGTIDAVLELKKTTDKIKENNIPIETEEIDYGDVYQITIKIKKTE